MRTDLIKCICSILVSDLRTDNWLCLMCIWTIKRCKSPSRPKPGFKVFQLVLNFFLKKKLTGWLYTFYFLHVLQPFSSIYPWAIGLIISVHISTIATVRTKFLFPPLLSKATYLREIKLKRFISQSTQLGPFHNSVLRRRLMKELPLMSWKTEFTYCNCQRPYPLWRQYSICSTPMKWDELNSLLVTDP